MACDKCSVASTASVFSRYECGADSAILWQLYQKFSIIKADRSTSLSETQTKLVIFKFAQSPKKCIMCRMYPTHIEYFHNPENFVNHANISAG